MSAIPATSQSGPSTGNSVGTSLYNLAVPTFLQTVRAVLGFLDRATAHCAETGTHPDDFVRARLTPDMAPLHFQLECVANHSYYALEGIKTGVFAPPDLREDIPFANLRAVVAEAEELLRGLTPDEVNSWAGRELNFKIGPRQLSFTAETFLLSFSLPNFYFHAVTAYDILRVQGVPIGKRDFEGVLRVQPAE